MEKRGLGRGLSALMADVGMQPTAADSQPNEAAVVKAPIERVFPNPNQPRRSFDSDELSDLARSIGEKGILQPLIVRAKLDDPLSYEIVAGERRWRAAQMANLHEVPVLVRSFDDLELLEIAIIENIQRTDLNPIEEAMGYRQLMDKFGHTQEKLAEAMGKSRSYIANLLRLLQLPDEVLAMVSAGQLSAGHARALVPTATPLDLARKVIQSGLSVRETENLVKNPTAPKAPKAEKDADTKALEQDLSANIGMKVQVNHNGTMNKGQVTIQYQSLDELDAICRLLSITPTASSI